MTTDMIPAALLMNIALDCIDTTGGDTFGAREMARDWIADEVGGDCLDTKVEMAFAMALASGQQAGRDDHASVNDDDDRPFVEGETLVIESGRAIAHSAIFTESVEVIVDRVTDKAVKLRHGSITAWFPKSALSPIRGNFSCRRVEVARWLRLGKRQRILLDRSEVFGSTAVSA